MKRNGNHVERGATRTPRHPKIHHRRVDSDRRIPVELQYEAARAEKVYIAGDFNRWRAGDLPLRRDGTGALKAELWLAPGRYEYRFLVDGEWQDDPHALHRVPNEFGTSNCVLEVCASCEKHSAAVSAGTSPRS